MHTSSVKMSAKLSDFYICCVQPFSCKTICKVLSVHGCSIAQLAKNTRHCLSRRMPTSRCIDAQMHRLHRLQRLKFINTINQLDQRDMISQLTSAMQAGVYWVRSKYLFPKRTWSSEFTFGFVKLYEALELHLSDCLLSGGR